METRGAGHHPFYVAQGLLIGSTQFDLPALKKNRPVTYHVSKNDSVIARCLIAVSPASRVPTGIGVIN